MSSLGQPLHSRRAALGLGLAAAGSAALTACGPTSPTATPPSAGTTAGAKAGQLPGYFPYEGVKADKPGNAQGVPPVFYNYPKPPFQREGFPYPGGQPSWKAMMQAVPTKVPAAQNKCFAAFAAATGADFEIVYGTSVQYLEKFQVMMASNDIADLCMIVPVAQLPKLLEKNFTDLTDILAGDGIKKYPGLANIPTPAWQVPQLNGRIWGIPQARPPAGNVLNSRGDLMAQRGISDPSVKPRDGKDFVDLLKQLTDKKNNKFAMGVDPNGWLVPILLTMVGAPNNWKEEGGKFINQMETEEYKTALAKCGEIIQAGYLHPNSFSEPANNRPWFETGVTALYSQSFISWSSEVRNNPSWNVGMIELPKWDGGGPAPIRKSVPGYYSYVGIKKADAARVDQMLKICDYVASPFGTQQLLDSGYGVEGYTYTINEQGNPVSKSDSPGTVPMAYAGAIGGSILFGRGIPSSVDIPYEYLQRALPAGLDDPTIGLYSETYNAKSATMLKQQQDVQREIMLGQKPMTAWDEFVKAWKAQVGDKSAAEYAEAAAHR